MKTGGWLGLWMLLGPALCGQTPVADPVLANRGPFTRADSLRGSLGEHRTGWDVTHYTLNIQLLPDSQRIEGVVSIRFRALRPVHLLQIDLMPFYRIGHMTFELPGAPSFPVGVPAWWRDTSLSPNVVWVKLSTMLDAGEEGLLRIRYAGAPRVAPNPPWEGGFTWAKDANGLPWVAVSCEGFGASSWWPLKDHLSDEPDSLDLTLDVPDPLVAVGNGRWVGTDTLETPGGLRRQYHWKVSYPINSYNVTLVAGDLVPIRLPYSGRQGPLDVTCWVLRQNREKAAKYFAREVPAVLDFYEATLGPYPYYRDGYKLVETPFWGMEHQSAIAYGNNYRLNEQGWDYIILHETGHEWFGNLLSVNDHGELWVHESFTTYTEALFEEHRKGKEAYLAYLNSQKPLIVNQEPILGPLGVNYTGWEDADMYYKGAWMLHGLRLLVNNDKLFLSMFPALLKQFAHQTVSGSQVIDFMCQHLGRNYRTYLSLYLSYADLPRLQYGIRMDKNKEWILRYRWKNAERGLRMPVVLRSADGQELKYTPSDTWQSARIPSAKRRKTYPDLVAPLQLIDLERDDNF